MACFESASGLIRPVPKTGFEIGPVSIRALQSSEFQDANWQLEGIEPNRPGQKTVLAENSFFARAIPAPFGFNSSTSSNGDDVSLYVGGETAAATRRGEPDGNVS